MIRKRTPLEREVDQELISKGKEALKDFDESNSFRVVPSKQESKLISIRLPMEMIRQLREVASQRGDIGYQQLIRLYLAEALLREGLRKEAGDLVSELASGARVFSTSVSSQSDPGRLQGEIEAEAGFGVGPYIEGPFTEGHVAPIRQGEQVA